MREREREQSSASDRRTFDAKTIMVSLSLIFGGGGVIGGVNYYTNPNIELQRRIGAVETLGNEQQVQLSNITGKNRLDELTLHQYITSHKEETDLKEQLMDHKLADIEKLLKEISMKLDRP